MTTQPNSRMSVAEAEQYLRDIGVFWNGFEYLKDHHWQKYICTDINSPDDCYAFFEQLAQDNIEHTDPGPFRWGCSKARSAKAALEQYLVNGLLDSTAAVKVALSRARRVCCRCHELGSYKRCDELPVNHGEHFKRRQNAKSDGTTTT